MMPMRPKKNPEEHMTPNTQTPRIPSRGALKLKDACEYLGGVSPITVRRLISRGLIKANRSLRHILIPVAELDRFIHSGTD
jgi:excisionase family DNA binding protein